VPDDGLTLNRYPRVRFAHRRFANPELQPARDAPAMEHPFHRDRLPETRWMPRQQAGGPENGITDPPRLT
jgi:hypothetical protein